MHCVAARYGSILYVCENLLVHLCLSCKDGVWWWVAIIDELPAQTDDVFHSARTRCCGIPDVKQFQAWHSKNTPEQQDVVCQRSTETPVPFLVFTVSCPLLCYPPGHMETPLVGNIMTLLGEVQVDKKGLWIWIEGGHFQHGPEVPDEILFKAFEEVEPVAR